MLFQVVRLPIMSDLPSEIRELLRNFANGFVIVEIFALVLRKKSIRI